MAEVKTLAPAVTLVLAVALFAVGSTLASSDPHLRVIVPRAAVRTGPAFTYRELYRAERDEVMRVVDRSGAYWFRVILPDGRFGWIYGEQVLPFEVELGATRSSRAWAAFRGALFAPSPIPEATIGLTFSGGALGGDGLFIVRPSVVLDSHFGLEGHIGEAVGADGSLLVYGLGGDIFVWPLGPLIPFVSLGGGAGTSLPKVNGVTQTSRTQLALDAGGGMAIVFRKRITLRFDVRNYTLFTPSTTSNRQEYSGGLAIFF